MFGSGIVSWSLANKNAGQKESRKIRLPCVKDAKCLNFAVKKFVWLMIRQDRKSPTFIFYAWLLLCTICSATAQVHLYPYTLPTVSNAEVLSNPWTGGFDLPQWSMGDLNQDGVDELAVFDRAGDFWLIFSWENGTWVSRPELALKMPACRSFALLRDYNGDGIADIFTQTTGGIRLYRGSNEGLYTSFSVESNLIEYNTGFGNSNIYNRSIDIPHIGDMDGDGDLDILSFEVIGTTLPLYKNLSAELGYARDSLLFIQEDPCWGDFKESETDNNIQLAFSCDGKRAGPKHAGSTELVFDGDGDGDFDLVLGDISSRGLSYLENIGGGVDSMIRVDYTFPSNSLSVDMPIFPAAYAIDVDMNGVQDLVVSPNGNSRYFNLNNAWLYRFDDNTTPNFVFDRQDFLIETTLDLGSDSYGVFYDVDEDGLQDLLLSGSSIYRAVGDDSNGQIAYYRNTGNATTPAFNLESDDWLGLSFLGYFRYRPCFGDIDNDGFDDMLLGNSEGRLIHFERNATGSFVFDTTFYCGIDVGNAAHPTLFDVDDDGDLDLVIGKEYLGSINYYPNLNPADMTPFQPDSLNGFFGGISVSEGGFIIGNAVPHFIESNEEVLLLVGGSSGKTAAYVLDSDSLLSGSFSVASTKWGGIDVGTEAAPFTSDINNDGSIDVLYGNRRGGLNLFSEVITDSSQILGLSTVNTDNKLALFPNPVRSQLTISGLPKEEVELKIIDLQGRVIEVYIVQSNDGQVTLDLTFIEKGMYLGVLSNRNFAQVTSIFSKF
tara:strand:+ start:1809 stop:4127 length:2319 start_codon:yes stop_codon:yes gene_type:complete